MNDVEVVEGVEGEVCELEEQGKTVVLVAVDGEERIRSAESFNSLTVKLVPTLFLVSC